MHNVTRGTSNRTNVWSSNSLALIGVIGLIAGTAFYLKRNGDARHPIVEESSDNLRLLGVLGAALAGAALGAAIKKGKLFSARGQSDVTLASHVIIDRPPNEVYRYWKDLRHLPRVMNFLKQVEPQEGNISHWVAQGPVGPSIEWDSEIIDDEPERMLSWHSLEGSELINWGTVTFSPRDNGERTELSIAFNFCPPENMTGAIARLLSGIENISLDQNLLNLKSHLESGEGST